MAHPHGRSPQPKKSGRAKTRRFRSRGVDVEIREAPDRVELLLDGNPVDVEVIDGEFHSQLANQFTAFASIDDVVDTLLANEGRTWTLHGHVCDERCAHGKHHHDHADGHEHVHGHEHRDGR
jgi:hypothetical protein